MIKSQLSVYYIVCNFLDHWSWQIRFRDKFLGALLLVCILLVWHVQFYLTIHVFCTYCSYVNSARILNWKIHFAGQQLNVLSGPYAWRNSYEGKRIQMHQRGATELFGIHDVSGNVILSWCQCPLYVRNRKLNSLCEVKIWLS